MDREVLMNVPLRNIWRTLPHLPKCISTYLSYVKYFSYMPEIDRMRTGYYRMYHHPDSKILCSTLGDVTKFSDFDLMQFRGIGPNRIEEIEKGLAYYGLHLQKESRIIAIEEIMSNLYYIQLIPDTIAKP